MTAGGASLIRPAVAQTAAARGGRPNHHYLPATADTVHWGYFSKLLKPLVEIDSGDYVTIEVLTHHANDDAERMIKGDPGAESVFLWTKEKKGVDRRGAGPVDGKLLGRGSGEGFGVHICTGPVFVRGAELGDILEVRMDVKPRPCANPMPARRSAVTPLRGGVTITRTSSPNRNPAKSSRFTRSTRPASETRPPRSTISDGRRRLIRSEWSIRPSIIPACRSITERSKKTTAFSRTCGFHCSRISVSSVSPRRRRTTSIRFRPITSAETWTTGAWARVRLSIIRFKQSVAFAGAVASLPGPIPHVYRPATFDSGLRHLLPAARAPQQGGPVRHGMGAADTK